MKADKWIYINMLVGKLWLAVSKAVELHQQENISERIGSVSWYWTQREIRENYKGHPEEKHFQNADMWMMFSRLSDDDKLKLYSAYPSFKMRLCFKNNNPSNLMLKEVDLSWSDHQRIVELDDYMEK